MKLPKANDRRRRTYFLYRKRWSEEAQKLMNELRLIKIAVSLGDAETLIQHPTTMTHSVVPDKERLEMGITDNYFDFLLVWKIMDSNRRFKTSIC